MPGGNKSYNNAANMERRVKARLEQDGFTVFRTAGSHSPADLIALTPMQEPVYFHGATEHLDETCGRWMIQVKGGAATMTKKAQLEFADFAARHRFEAILVERGMVFSRLSPSGEDATQNDRGRSGIGD